MPTVTTKLQLTTDKGIQYSLFCVYPFLYTPADNSRLIVNDIEYLLIDMFDIISSEGDITRYLRYG